jgi:hypothetical protein
MFPSLQFSTLCQITKVSYGPRYIRHTVQFRITLFLKLHTIQNCPSCVLILSVPLMRCIREFLDCQKRNAGLTYLILAATSFKLVPLRMYTAIPSLLHASKGTWKSFSLTLPSTVCDYFSMSDIVSKRHPFSSIFNLGKKAKSQGAKPGKKGGWGMITMLLLALSCSSSYMFTQF